MKGQNEISVKLSKIVIFKAYKHDRVPTFEIRKNIKQILC